LLPCAQIAFLPTISPAERLTRLSQAQPPVTIVPSDTDPDPAICAANALGTDPTALSFTADQPGQWLCCDLADRGIQPSGWEIRSGEFPPRISAPG
jgi:hypothetical protein